MNNNSVLIAGGGMIGMTAACLLAKSGLHITLVESGPARQWDNNQSPGRVSALNLASQNILEAAGVWQAMQKQRVSPYRQMKVWDSHSNASIHFDAAESALPCLGHIVENDLAIQMMREKLTHNYNVKLLFNSKVVGLESASGSISATLQTPDGPETVKTTLAIGADGAQSSLRRLADIPVVCEQFDQEAIVATVDCEHPHQETAWQCFTPSGPIAMLPLLSKQCSLVYSCDKAEADRVMAAGKEDLARLLGQLFGDVLGQITILNAPRSFSLANQHAETYIGEHLALVGDAAHTTHPLAGLGANIGLLDVAALCELVEQAHTAGRPVAGRSLLRRYERWRRGDNAAVLAAMKTFKAAFGNTDPLMTRLRESSFLVADQVTPLKVWLSEYATGVSGDIPKICQNQSS